MGGEPEGQTQQFTLRAFDEPRLFHQVARRIATQGEFGKYNKVSAASVCAFRALDHQIDVAGKVSDGGINLSQGNFHGLSLIGLCCVASCAMAIPIKNIGTSLGHASAIRYVSSTGSVGVC